MFLVLMLANGRAPILPPWPIVEIKLQGKVDGWETDDLVVIVENPRTGQRRRLLGQVRRTISVIRGNAAFAEAVSAAWHDFNNTKLFTKGNDAIALMTGLLSGVDARTVPWLLEHARAITKWDEFMRDVRTSNFSPPKAEVKLEIIRYHLQHANDDAPVSSEMLHDFLRHFHLLSSDFGGEHGIGVSLLHSHILQFVREKPEWVWARAVEVVRNTAKTSGVLTKETVPEDLINAFTASRAVHISAPFASPPQPVPADWGEHSALLAMLTLVGGWIEANQHDFAVVARIADREAASLADAFKEILHLIDSPLILRGGVSRITNRPELLEHLGALVFERDLLRFEEQVIRVLAELNPALDMPPETRFMAQVQGKVLLHSSVLRNGLAEGVALLGTRAGALTSCPAGRTQNIAERIVWQLLCDADWKLWGSLEELLPILAEAAPRQFLRAVEGALARDPSPLDELIRQQGHGPWGGDYLTGLLWALEALAWNEEYLVPVCDMLAQLALRSSGTLWHERPVESIATILLPWFPQTLASIKKRQVALNTLVDEYENIAWKVVLRLLPNQYQTTRGTYRARWHTVVPEDLRPNVPNSEYWEQVRHYADLALKMAKGNTQRLEQLLELNLKDSQLVDGLIELLSDPSLSQLPEEERLSLWSKLNRTIIKHREYAGNWWALDENRLVELDHASAALAPKDPINVHQPLFTAGALRFVDPSLEYPERAKQLEERRREALQEIWAHRGLDGVVELVRKVESPTDVGRSLAAVGDSVIDRTLLPQQLNSEDAGMKAFLRGYVLHRYYKGGRNWVDELAADFPQDHLEAFLYFLPFTEATWDRAARWLGKDEFRYWKQTIANPCQAEGPLQPAVDKLLAHDRPIAAVNCLHRMLHTDEAFDTEQCAAALLRAPASKERGLQLDVYETVQLIQALQQRSDTPQDAMLKVEWTYLQWLDGTYDGRPLYLYRQLATDPEFFASIIRILYQPTNGAGGTDEPEASGDGSHDVENMDYEDESHAESELTEADRAVAENAWELLRGWDIVPGTQAGGAFSGEAFTEWFGRVQELCRASGHLSPALYRIGSVMIHAPSDPDGLWIHRVAASALNHKDANSMRSGFRTALFNSRGAHVVDPSGTSERRLAERYRDSAEALEDAGYHRLAVELRALADDYERQADQVAERYGE